MLEEGQLSKPKEELVEDYEKEHKKYMKDTTDIQGQMEDLVMKAEELMAGISNQPVSNTAGGVTAVSGETAAASADSDIFRPHQNLKPNYLEKNATHVEVTTSAKW